MICLSEALAARQALDVHLCWHFLFEITFTHSTSRKLPGEHNKSSERLLRGVCPNKVKDLTTLPRLSQAVAKTLSLPMVQAIASQVDADQAVPVVAEATLRAEGKQPSFLILRRTVNQLWC